MIELPIRAWAPRHLTMVAPTGVGKTYATIKAIAKLVNGGKRILYLVPNHTLSSQIENDFFQAGINAKVFKGAKGQCKFPEALKATLALHNPIKNVCGPDENGKECPLKGPCAYWANIHSAATADVVICSHEFLFLNLPFDFDPSAVVIDEGFFGAAFRKIEILPSIFYPNSVSVASTTLASANASLLAPLTATTGFLTVPINLTAKIAESAFEEARKIVHSIPLFPGLSAAEYEGMISAHASTCSEAKTMELVWDAIRRALDDGHRQVSSMHVGSGSVIDFVYVRPIRQKLLQLPILHLDATAEPDLLNALFDWGIEIRNFSFTPANLKFIRVRGKYGKMRLTGDPNLRSKINDFIIRNRSGPALTVTHDSIENDFPPDTAHFNALRGQNNFSHLNEMFIVGRPMPPDIEIWRHARAFFGYTGPQPHMVRQRGGMMYPNPQHQAIVRAITEAEVIQAIGRLRAGDKPNTNCLVWLLNDSLLHLPISKTVDLVPTPIWWPVMKAHGLFPESPREAYRLGVFNSEVTAKRAYARAFPPPPATTAPISPPTPPPPPQSPHQILLRKVIPGTVAKGIFAIISGLPGWQRIEYSPPGARSKPTAVWTDLPPASLLGPPLNARQVIYPPIPNQNGGP
jgi:hypothetical protein